MICKLLSLMPHLHVERVIPAIMLTIGVAGVSTSLNLDRAHQYALLFSFGSASSSIRESIDVGICRRDRFDRQ